MDWRNLHYDGERWLYAKKRSEEPRWQFSFNSLVSFLLLSPNSGQQLEDYDCKNWSVKCCQITRRCRFWNHPHEPDSTRWPVDTLKTFWRELHVFPSVYRPISGSLGSIKVKTRMTRNKCASVWSRVSDSNEHGHVSDVNASCLTGTGKYESWLTRWNGLQLKFQVGVYTSTTTHSNPLAQLATWSSPHTVLITQADLL